MMIGKWLNIIYLIIYHVTIISVIYETNLCGFWQNDTINKIGMSFTICSSREFDAFIIDFEGMNGFIEEVGGIQFIIKILHDEGYPWRGTMVIRINKYFITFARFFLY
jgi:hypothetical protein